MKRGESLAHYPDLMKLSAVLLLGMFILALPAANADDVGPEDKGTPGAVSGWIRDLACLMHYKQVLKPENDCAEMCARLGAPLILITREGTIYLPISTTIPDKDQRGRLMPHVGKYARITGRIFERGGVRAISVEKIEQAPEK